MLERVLEARERRAEIRSEIAKLDIESISLSFNIPGYPKSDEIINLAFLGIVEELKSYLSACRINYVEKSAHTSLDEAGDFFILPLLQNKYTNREIKSLLEDFEINHTLSRLLDVDLFDKHAKPVSSGKAKKCMICDKPAIVCMREGNHSFQDLQDFIHQQIHTYIDKDLENNITQSITSYASRALMYEVSVAPKPGLVDRYSQGSHTDMDFYTFVSSSAALSFYWKDIAALAFKWDGKEKQKTLIALRMIGMKMERAMLNATEEINTQKGAIYIMGFTAFAMAYLLKNKIQPKEMEIRSVLKYLNTDIVANELSLQLTNKIDEEQTHGDKVFAEYGLELGGGVRKEMEEGLPLIFDYSLPYLKSLGHIEATDQAWNTVLRDVLMLVMSVNDDTNILYRSDLHVLSKTKELARFAFQSKDIEKLDKMNDLVEFCEKHNISPGGSADLLATTCFIYWIQREYNNYIFI
jgi:holo-ACP synthase/triphosphoribosyl-dephospho-CoA synthase